MGRKHISLAVITALAMALLLLVDSTGNLLADGDDEAVTVPSSRYDDVNTPLRLGLGEFVTLTLITGERVRATGAVDGKLNIESLPAIRQSNDATLSMPDTKRAPESQSVQKLDSAFFDIEYLVSERFHERPDLPVILTATDVDSLVLIETLVTSLGGSLTWTSENLSIIAATLPYQHIGAVSTELAASHLIKKIWLDAVLRVVLDTSLPIIDVPTLHSQGNQGEGIIIAVLDTGIDSTHPDLDDLDDDPTTFDPKIVYTFNHTNETSTVEDLMGHGTHVAGIAAGTGKTSLEINPTGPHYVGVAPKAVLWNIKILNKNGSGSVVQIAQGLERTSLGPDRVPRSGDEPDVINLSVGNGFNGDGSDIMSRAVDFAVDQGVTVAVAAGNRGPGLSSVGQPAVSKRGITVGATTKSDDIVGFSGRGPTTDRRLKPDVVAPGVGIVSTCAILGNYNCRFAGDRYTTLSGTSMATPHVAGTVALILEEHPDWTPEQVKSALMNTAHDLGVSLREQGAGQIHAPSAVSASLLAWEPSVSFGLVTINQRRTQAISIENLTGKFVSAQATASTSLSGIPSDLVTVSPSTFNIPAGETSTVVLDLGPVGTQSPQGWYEGRVRIGSTVGEIFVPYLFFVSQPSEVEVTPDVFDQIPAHQFKQISRTLNIINSGSGPVGFAILEDASTGGQTTSGEKFFIQTLNDDDAPVFAQALPIIGDDPAADDSTSSGSAKVDVLQISAKSNDQFLALQIGFSKDTQMAEVRGKIFLDVDQDPSTGRPPTFGGGLPNQDIGYEYYIDLEDVLTQNLVKVFDKNDNLRGVAPGQIIGNTVAITVPTSEIGDGDGSVDLVAMFSNLSEPTDWAPDVGHSALNDSDVPWISFTPPYGTVEPNTTSQVTVTFDARFAPVGSHSATILVGNNDPGSLITVVPAIVNVEQGQNANIHVGPTTFSTDLVSGDSVAESFTVSNLGNGVLSITLSDEDLMTGLDAAWLSLEAQAILVDPAGGTDDVQVVFDATGLPTGTYDAEITVDHNDPLREPIIVSATLDVSAPEMTLSASEFQIGQEPGRVSTHTLTIGNVGSGTLNFEIDDVFDLEPRPSSISPTSSPKIAVFEDALPWGRTVLRDVLRRLAIDFDVFTSSDMGTINLAPYSKIVISSAQSQEFYTALVGNTVWFEDYVTNGGVLEMHLDADGRLHQRPGLPGGFVLSNASAFRDVRVLQPKHSIFNDPNFISDAELSYWNPSAKSYLVYMPEDADILVEWQSAQQPIAAEYTMGKGRILVTTQFVEHIYTSERFLENLLSYRASDSPWLAVEPDSASIASGSQIEVTFTVDSEDLDGGIHRSSLQLSTNDPLLPQRVVPFTMSIVGPPSLVAPPDGTKSPDRDWALEWITVPSVLEYFLEVDMVPAFDSIDLIQITSVDPQHDVNLDQTGLYYWRVKGKIDGVVETSWSETRRFAVVDPVVRVSTDIAPDKSPALLELANGKLIAAWSNGDDIWSSISLDGGDTWSDQKRVTAESTGASSADLHEAANGTLWLTYWAWDGTNADVWARTSLNDGTTWSNPVRISQDLANDFDPSITQAADGTIWVVWSSPRNGINEIWHRMSEDNGQSWSNSAALSVEGGAKSYPDITAAPGGKLLLTWQECATFCRIMFARSEDDAAWSPPIAVSNSQLDNRWPTMEGVQDGNIWIAWTTWHNENPNAVWNWDVFYTLSQDFGTTWTDEQQFTTHAGPDERPEIATLAEMGTIALAWHSQRTGNLDVWFGVVDHLEDVLVPPLVTNIVHRPVPNPEAGDLVTITARIADQVAVQSAQVVWSMDGTGQPQVVMFDDGTNGDATVGDGVLTTQIGPFQAGSLIDYQIQATNIHEVSVVFPTEPKSFEVLQTFQPTTSNLLIVDSNQMDQVALVAPFYMDALDSIAQSYDYWDVSRRGAVGPEVLSAYAKGIVIWSMPFCCGTLAGSETQLHLETYLESGGKLFLSGQDAAQKLQGSHLLRQTLGTIFVRPSTDETTLNGVEDDPVGDQLLLEAHEGDGANNQVSPDEVAPLLEHATPSFKYDEGAGSVAIRIGGIRTETESYKAILLAFGFEAINTSLMRTKVLRRAVNWLRTNVDNQVRVSPVTNDTAMAGATLSVAIKAEAIQGLRHADVLLDYDRSVLSVQNAQVAKALGVNCEQESFSILPEGLQLGLSCTDDEAGSPLPLWQVDFEVADLSAPVVTTMLIAEVTLSNGHEPPDLIFGYGGSVSVDVSLGECGDLNGDGEVTIQDAIASLQNVMGRIELTGRQRFLADVVPTGVLDVLDVILLLQHLVGVAVVDECGQV